jgi:hypothetical protein
VKSQAVQAAAAAAAADTAARAQGAETAESNLSGRGSKDGGSDSTVHAVTTEQI